MFSDYFVLVGAGLATTGWLYTARRARTLAKKQHTLNVLIHASFNKDFRETHEAVAKCIRAGPLPDLLKEENLVIRQNFRVMLNHYEFVASALRNGDLDETLIRDSERGTILHLYENCIAYIEGLRTTRRRRSIYEHLEWLYRRWETKPPSRICSVAEWCRGKPFKGRQEKVRRD